LSLLYKNNRVISHIDSSLDKKQQKFFKKFVFFLTSTYQKISLALYTENLKDSVSGINFRINRGFNQIKVDRSRKNFAPKFRDYFSAFLL